MCAAHADMRWDCIHLPLQDVVAGDGTTSVTVLCGALLKKSLELLEKGVRLAAGRALVACVLGTKKLERHLPGKGCVQGLLF